MTLHRRRLLFIGFIVSFACASIVVLLYANGYRYHAKKRSIEKAGELVIESIPRNSDVLLDGEMLHLRLFGFQLGNVKTPAQVKYIPSGDYHVELSKAGYMPWKTDISIYSGQSTVIKNITLFPRLSPSLVIKQKNIKTIGRLNANQLYVATEEALYVYNEITKTFSKLYSGRSLASDSFEPSPRGGNLLFKDGDTFMTVAVNEGKQYALNRLKNWNKVHWFGEHTLIGRTRSGLHSFELVTQEEKSLYRDEVYDINTQQGAYVLSSGYDSAILSKISSSTSRLVEMARFPSVYRSITSVNEDMVVLADMTGNNALYVLNKNENHLLALPPGNIIWQSPNRFIVAGDFELWLYEQSSPGEFTTSLLTRQSGEIQKALFLKNNPYLFFISKGAIKTIDTSSQGALNRYAIESENASEFLFSNDFKRLYVIETIKGKPGLYQYDLESWQ